MSEGNGAVTRTGAGARVVALIDAVSDGGPDGGPDGMIAAAAALSVAAAGGIPPEAVVLGDEDAGRAALAVGMERVWLVPAGGPTGPADARRVGALFAAAMRHETFRAAGDEGVALLPADPFGDEVAAYLAVAIDGTVLGRCGEIAIGAEGVVASRSIYGGRGTMSLTVGRGFGIATMRATKAPPSDVGTVGELVRLETDPVPPAPLAVDRSEAEGGVVKLEGARLIVSGGRGVNDEEGFALLGELADRLGAALGGSLPSVDAGFVPVSRQVGQSGNFVTPEVYLAVGISGTPQHLAGIGTATRIVAVNNDADADIFRFADVGVVADWRQVIPALIERLRPAG